jgi:hypothetical protein
MIVVRHRGGVGSRIRGPFARLKGLLQLLQYLYAYDVETKDIFACFCRSCFGSNGPLAR